MAIKVSKYLINHFFSFVENIDSKITVNGHVMNAIIGSLEAPQ